jgi:hypothetical protein
MAADHLAVAPGLERHPTGGRPLELEPQGKEPIRSLTWPPLQRALMRPMRERLASLVDVTV